MVEGWSAMDANSVGTALMRQPGNEDAISRLPQEPRGARCTEQGEGFHLRQGCALQMTITGATMPGT